MTRVLIVDDRPALRAVLAEPLRRAGYEVHELAGRTDAVDLTRVSRYQVAFLGLHPQPASHIGSIGTLIARARATAVVAFTDGGCVAEAVQVIKAGAHDYLQLPIDADSVVRVLREIVDERRHHGAGLNQRPQPPSSHGSRSFIAADTTTKHLFERACRVAEVDCTVLITGESGTGKEVVASHIFNNSRRHGRFVPVNCGAIPDTLIESELFGYHKGAFTGATSDKPGLVEQADGGVLFLDEIGEMSPRFQVTLLRFLDQSELRRVGGTAVRRVNTRILAATNRRLDQEVQRGTFRHDLYYRLSVVSLQVAPLRERPEDIPALAEHFFRRAAEKFHKDVRSMSPEALALMCQYDWPGNVRELQNVVEAGVALSTDPVVGVEALPASVRNVMNFSGCRSNVSLELASLTQVIERFGGNHTQAAAALGVSRTTLWRKLRRTQEVQMAIGSRS